MRSVQALTKVPPECTTTTPYKETDCESIRTTVRTGSLQFYCGWGRSCALTSEMATPAGHLGVVTPEGSRRRWRGWKEEEKKEEKDWTDRPTDRLLNGERATFGLSGLGRIGEHRHYGRANESGKRASKDHERMKEEKGTGAQNMPGEGTRKKSLKNAVVCARDRYCG